MEAAMTTEAAPRKKRMSKRALRAWAWVTGAVSFALPGALFTVAPKPAVADAVPVKPKVIVRHKVVKRVVWVTDAPAASAPQVTYVSGPAPAAPAPAANTGGS
jgi:hypothetical protein